MSLSLIVHKSLTQPNSVLWDKSPSDPQCSPCLPSEVKSLSVLPSPLLLPESHLTTLCCCPGPWSQLTQPLQKAERIRPNDGDAQGPPCVPHHLALPPTHGLCPKLPPWTPQMQVVTGANQETSPPTDPPLAGHPPVLQGHEICSPRVLPKALADQLTRAVTHGNVHRNLAALPHTP